MVAIIQIIEVISVKLGRAVAIENDPDTFF